MLKSIQSTTKKSFASDIMEEIPFLHPNEFHSLKLHKDKGKSDILKSTIEFIEKRKVDTNIEYIPFQPISTNSSKVLSVTDYIYGY